MEVIFADGGSTDDSLSIVQSYGSMISELISEPDRGQSDAINKGIRRSSGDIIAYVNSDDLLEPGALQRVSEYFTRHTDAEWLVGSCRVFGADTQEWILRPEGWTRLLDTVLPWSRPQQYVFPQSGASFMRRGLVERLGPYDESLHYSMDMEYYARAAFAGVKMHIVPDVLAAWRMHPQSKTWTRGCAYAFRQDECAILERYIPKLPDAERKEAEAALQRELPNLRLREAMYAARDGHRMRGLQGLLQLAAQYPSAILQRPWLGGMRRVLFGFQN